MATRQVVFECTCSSTVPGQYLAVVGSLPQLGSWNPVRSVRMHTTASSFPLWSSAPVCLPTSARGAAATPTAAAAAAAAAPDADAAAAAAAAAAGPIEFKFIIMRTEDSCVIWEPLTGNRLLPANTGDIVCRAFFGKEKEELLLLQQQQQQQQIRKQQGQQQEATWMGRLRESFSSSLKRLSSGVDLSPHSPAVSTPLSISPGNVDNCTRLLGPGSIPSTPSSSSSSSTTTGESGAAAAGGGAAAAAAAAAGAAGSMLSPSGALQMLVEKNSSAVSWGDKLELVMKIIKSIGDGSSSSSLLKCSSEYILNAIDALCYSAVYADFVAQGLIKCREDGRHFRPNRHANISREVSIHLELLLQAVASRTDDLGSIFRLITKTLRPSLPSFAAVFRVSQPLTRIRNIAHRDDIPMELKNEIKHTIQNKLHRCAGPEDLLTTEQLLKKIKTQSQYTYPSSFINEFEIFYNELRMFFNRTDISERLKQLLTTQTGRTAEAIHRYLDANERSAAADASPAKLLLSLGLATDLRCVLVLQLTDTGNLHDGDDHLIQNMYTKTLSTPPYTPEIQR